MKNRHKKVDRAAEYIRKKIGVDQVGDYRSAIILGSGAGTVAEKVTERGRISYTDIPGFPALMIEGHKGELLFGSIAQKNVILFNGRFHYYQGFKLEDVTMNVRIAKKLGIETLIITNACGGINRNFEVGDLMLITDHINYMGVNPLIGDSGHGPIFVDMSEPYDLDLVEKVKQSADSNEEIGTLREGVYLAVHGPSFETKAEISFFEKIGADAVGMSTVPEVIVAVQEGIRVIGISVVVNMACGITEGKLSHSETLKNMSRAGIRLGTLIEHILGKVL
jgi:purine-nucleoside phosphorylase